MLYCFIKKNSNKYINLGAIANITRVCFLRVSAHDLWWDKWGNAIVTHKCPNQNTRFYIISFWVCVLFSVFPNQLFETTCAQLIFLLVARYIADGMLLANDFHGSCLLYASCYGKFIFVWNKGKHLIAEKAHPNWLESWLEV